MCNNVSYYLIFGVEVNNTENRVPRVGNIIKVPPEVAVLGYGGVVGMVVDHVGGPTARVHHWPSRGVQVT